MVVNPLKLKGAIKLNGNTRHLFFRRLRTCFYIVMNPYNGRFRPDLRTHIIGPVEHYGNVEQLAGIIIFRVSGNKQGAASRYIL